MTNIATPAAITEAIASDCPFIAHRSRISFRSSARSRAGIVTIGAPARRSWSAFRSTPATWPSARRTTRSAMPAIAALCVMTTVAVPSSRLTRSSASSTTMPVVMSSAPVGSSHSSTSGRFAMARAIATRCCSPPESCAGKVIETMVEADHPERLLRRHRVLDDLGDERHVLARRQARDQVVELKDESHVRPAILGELRVVRRRQIVILVDDLARGRHVESAEDVEQGGLARSGRTEQDHELARKQVEIDAAERLHGDLAHLIDLRQRARREDGNIRRIRNGEHVPLFRRHGSPSSTRVVADRTVPSRDDGTHAVARDIAPLRACCQFQRRRPSRN